MISAYLFTHDVENTMKFFTETLGFQVAISMPGADGKTSFGIVRQGETTSFMIGEVQGDAKLNKPGEGVEFWVYSQDKNFDLDAYYAEVKSKGATVVEELADGYWGDRYFAITDPNGYHLTFAKTVEEVPNEEVLERAASFTLPS